MVVPITTPTPPLPCRFANNLHRQPHQSTEYKVPTLSCESFICCCSREDEKAAWMDGWLLCSSIVCVPGFVLSVGETSIPLHLQPIFFTIHPSSTYLISFPFALMRSSIRRSSVSSSQSSFHLILTVLPLLFGVGVRTNLDC